MNNDLRPTELVIEHALALTKLTREALVDTLNRPLGSTAAGRKLLNSRDFSIRDIAHLRKALKQH